VTLGFSLSTPGLVFSASPTWAVVRIGTRDPLSARLCSTFFWPGTFLPEPFVHPKDVFAAGTPFSFFHTFFLKPCLFLLFFFLPFSLARRYLDALRTGSEGSFMPPLFGARPGVFFTCSSPSSHLAFRKLTLPEFFFSKDGRPTAHA